MVYAVIDELECSRFWTLLIFKYVYTYIYIYTYMYTVYIGYSYIHVCFCICGFLYGHTFTHWHTRAHVHRDIRAYLHTYITPRRYFSRLWPLSDLYEMAVP